MPTPFKTPFDFYFPDAADLSIEPLLLRLVAAEAALTALQNAVGPGSTTPPTVSLTSPSPIPDITEPRVLDFFITVTSADGLVDVSSLQNGFAIARSTGTTTNLVRQSTSSNTDAKSVSTVSRLDATAFTGAFNDTYTLIAKSSVQDTDGNLLGADFPLGTFDVNIGSAAAVELVSPTTPFVISAPGNFDYTFKITAPINTVSRATTLNAFEAVAPDGERIPLTAEDVPVGASAVIEGRWRLIITKVIVGIYRIFVKANSIQVNNGDTITEEEELTTAVGATPTADTPPTITVVSPTTAPQIFQPTTVQFTFRIEDDIAVDASTLPNAFEAIAPDNSRIPLTPVAVPTTDAAIITGTWELDLSAPPPDGNYQIVDKANTIADTSGNTIDGSQIIQSVSLQVGDANALPQLAPPTLSTATDTAPTGDDITLNQFPSFEGTGAEPNTLITLYLAGNEIETTTSNGSGQWSIDVTEKVPVGVRRFTVTQGSGAFLSPLSQPQAITFEGVDGAVTVDITAGVPIPTLTEPGDVTLDITIASSAALMIFTTVRSAFYVEVLPTGGTSRTESLKRNSIVPATDNAQSFSGQWRVDAAEWSSADNGIGVIYCKRQMSDVDGNKYSPDGNDTEITRFNIAMANTARLPQLNAPILAAASDTGAVGDNVTADYRPVFEGTGASPGAQINLFIDGVEVDTENA